MRQKIEGNHRDDAAGNPGGGTTYGLGISISWQDGPLGRGDDRKEPSGAFVEGVIAAAIDRIEYYQRSRFNSAWNGTALAHLYAALSELDLRAQDREARAVEGTHAE